MYKLIGSDQKIYGPVTLAQLREWLNQGRLTGATMVLLEGSNEWRTLSSLPEFAVPPLVTMPVATTGHGGNGMALAGWIFAVASNLCCCGGVLFGVLGVVFCTIALTQHEVYPQQRGRGWAWTGLILSLIGLAVHSILPLIWGTVMVPQFIQHPHWRQL